MTSADAQLTTYTPAEEFRVLQSGIAQCNAALQAMQARTDISPQARQQYAQQATEYLQRATVRIHQLRRAGLQVLPAAPLTPAAATKAQRKLAKDAKKAAKRERRLKNMAQSALAAMPADSPGAAAARLLMDEGKDKEVRRQALHALIDSVPLNSPVAAMAKMIGKEMTDDDDDDDDD